MIRILGQSAKNDGIAEVTFEEALYLAPIGKAGALDPPTEVAAHR